MAFFQPFFRLSFGLSFGLAFAGAILLASLSFFFTNMAEASNVLKPAQQELFDWQTSNAVPWAIKAGFQAGDPATARLIRQPTRDGRIPSDPVRRLCARVIRERSRQLAQPVSAQRRGDGSVAEPAPL